MTEVVRATKIIRPEITVERPADPWDGGNREIWARHAEAPELDVRLVTVHYNYAYHDNSSIGIVAGRIADLLAGRDSGSGPKGENSRSEVEGEAPQSGGDSRIAQPSNPSSSSRIP